MGAPCPFSGDTWRISNLGGGVGSVEVALVAAWQSFGRPLLLVSTEVELKIRLCLPAARWSSSSRGRAGSIVVALVAARWSSSHAGVWRSSNSRGRARSIVVHWWRHDGVCLLFVRSSSREYSHTEEDLDSRR
jgi:hypothetical protein